MPELVLGQEPRAITTVPGGKVRAGKRGKVNARAGMAGVPLGKPNRLRTLKGSFLSLGNFRSQGNLQQQGPRWLPCRARGLESSP